MGSSRSFPRSNAFLFAFALTASAPVVACVVHDASVAHGQPGAVRESRDVRLAALPRPSNPRNFRDAKRELEGLYVAGDRREIYCGCRFDERKNVDFGACESAHPYVPDGHEAERASRMEWDHALPASWIFRTLPCNEAPRPPRVSRRDHCRDTSPEFEMAEGDMHNLLPSVGQLNAIRQNFPFGEIEGEERLAGCDFEVREGVVEPRPEARGDLARAILYAAATYGVPLRTEHYRTLRRWHAEDPPSAFERRRNERIEALQGNRNPFIDGTVRLP